ncbi:uncharacterized protein J7T54_007473 [Emericellopsis cladophorae]|uniref:Protein CMS1 n=1 Tax=Emericellopsis cladophorae TaxID=2686198 RepID=A0A9P9XY57_9HYPO|nr:uncharacterized protein J7T54_007473 [Emericellopsis cladophorae]KAI6779997.1 hypothetical protein J7T54_007473 [Emericellopsis cladophorae]
MSNPKKRSAEDGSSSQKSKKKKKANALAHDDLYDTELGVNTLFAKMDNQLLADYLAQKLTRFGSDLSPIEISDLTLPDNLPLFIEQFTDKPDSLSRPQRKKGLPHTLIVAGAGLRAADLTRAVKKFQGKDNLVAKLFAKHIKIEEQVNFLKNKKTGIGVGTPARLADLIDNGALSLENLQRIIVDASHIDQKKRGVIDMKDTMMPLARFLTKDQIKSRYGAEEKPVDLLFF